MPPDERSIQAEQGHPLRENLPPEYLRRMERYLDDEFPRFLEIYAQPAVAGLRVNTLKITVEDFLRSTPFRLESLAWTADGFTLLLTDPPLQPGKHPYHAAGLYYLQDPSAMAVVELLAPQPGEKVLDLSAAPGGKSTHMITRMQNLGLLVANEMHPKRAWDLAENLERWGAHNTTILNEDPRRLADHFGAFFDRVLVDAPCSGEGMFRKSQAARTAWTPRLVQSCALRQLNILDEAARLVRPGGMLAYSTCTFAPEEDENVIARFLENHSGRASAAFEVIQAQRQSEFSSGRPEWVENLASAMLPALLAAQLERTVRLWPHRGAPEGHFIALLKRTDEGALPSFKPHHNKVPPTALGAWRHFCQANLEAAFLPESLPGLALEGAYLYAVPSLLPPLGRLRAIHPGWWLGQVKANRCEPAHALAMGLKPEQAVRLLRLRPDDPAVAAYLHGESLVVAGEEGWVLVAVEGGDAKNAFPLGWGKRSGGVIKNKIPHGLRWS